MREPGKQFGIKGGINLLIYGNFWISTGAFVLVLQSFFLLEGSLNQYLFSFFVFFSTLFVYSLHRLASLKKANRSIMQPDREEVVSGLQRYIRVFTLLSLFCAGSLFFMLDVSWYPGIILPALISLGYALPVFKKHRRLRDIPFLKIFLVAFSWAWITAALPSIQVGLFGSIEGILLFFERFFFIFAITLPFDLRDFQVDKEAGVQTIPQILGVRKALVMALIFLAFSAALGLANLYVGLYNSLTFGGLFTSLVVAAGVINQSDQSRSDIFYSGCVDGLIPLQYLLVWLPSQLIY